jgi:hypothetical protein
MMDVGFNEEAPEVNAIRPEGSSTHSEGGLE